MKVKSNIQVKRVITCKRDELILKQGIQNWLLNPDRSKPTWNQLLYDLVMKCNNGPELKYCYFNNRYQRIDFKPDFLAWAVSARDAMVAALKKIYA